MEAKGCRVKGGRVMEAGHTVVAGWYPNPDGTGQRYWDGSKWTEHTSGVQSVPPPPPAPQSPPGGWYSNPEGPGTGQRYWDGRKWTEHTSGVQTAPQYARSHKQGGGSSGPKVPPPQRGPRLSRRARWVIGIVGSIIVLSIIGAAMAPPKKRSSTSAESADSSSATPSAPATPAKPAPPPKPSIHLSVTNDTATVYAPSVMLRGKVTKGAKVKVDGKSADVTGKRWTLYVTLDRGDNSFTIKAKRRGYTAASVDADVTRRLSAAELAVIRQEKAARRANRRALQSAESYLAMGGFSKQGLYEQLSSSAGEGFTPTEAQYAVDHVDADWNQEAVQAARSYLQTSPMSRAELIDQLSSSAGEGFTYEQALYAVNKVY